MRRRSRLDFIGTFRPDAFAGFVAHRARRLDLRVRIDRLEAERVGVMVEGEPDLIDAFEMACSLGPADCLVLDVVRRDLPPSSS
jgi:acylphosphatase